MLLDTLLAKKVHKSRNVKADDKHLLSLLKGISWRIVGTLDTMLISYLVTGRLDMAISIGSIEVFTKITLYYLHERAWIIAKRKFKSNEA